MNKYKCFVSSSLLIALLFFPSFLYSQSGYKITKFIEIDTTGRWDYLSIDETTHRLYVSHDTEVDVVNLDNDSLIGKITNQNGVHGISFAPEFGKGYITNGKDNSVTVFDLKNLKILKSIKISGKKPDAVIYDPFSKRIFSFNNSSANATAIDPKTDTIAGNVNLEEGPEFAASDLAGKIYVNSEEKHVVVCFDALTLKQLAAWPLKPGEAPTGLSIDIAGKRVFSSCGNKLLTVINTETGKVIKTLPIGGRVDACAYDEAEKMIYISNGEGTITVIKQENPDSYKVLENIATLKGARTMTVDKKTHALYSTVIKEVGKDEKTGKILRSFGVLKIEKIKN